MPTYNDADDSDAWRDDESMASTDDFSSHTDDIESIEDSDFEFLTRSSSQAPDEEESDSDDLESIHTNDGTNSILTGVPTEDIENVLSSELEAEEHLADTVLRSTELPRVTRDNLPMEDSTSTITPPSIQRHDTVTPRSETHNVDTPSQNHPFNILYGGERSMKSTVLRKLGQSLMAATLKEKSQETTPPSSSSSSFITDWTSGCTSVVPITDFDTSDSPEVEFVEDSLVKMRVQEMDNLYGYGIDLRLQHFMCEMDQKTRVVSCRHHRSERRTVCPWFENVETCPSLMVYHCSPAREEKTDFELQKIEMFAEIHHFPLLVISDWEKSNKVYSFGWSGNTPVYTAGVTLGYEWLTPKKFLDLDSVEFGRSLWKGAVLSQDKVKSSRKINVIHTLKKGFGFRIAATVLLAFLVLFFNISFFGTTTPEVPMPSMKDVNTPYTSPLEIMSLPASTVTVTEHSTITVPIVRTKTVTTSPTATPNQKPVATSTIVLDPIYSRVNVPKASLVPRVPGVEYGYAFGYDDQHTLMYLESSRSVMLRLPAVYRESVTIRPVIKLSVSRNGKPVPFEVREWKKNDLAFIEWSAKDCHDSITIHAWTEKSPLINEKVIVDYSEPMIDPKLWEILEKSHQAAWKEVFRVKRSLDAKMKSLAKDVSRRVSDPTSFHAMEDKVSDYMRKLMTLQNDMREAAERHYDDVKSKYLSKFTVPTLSENDVRVLVDAKEQFQQQVDEYFHTAQTEAVLLSEKVKDLFRPSRKQESWGRVKDWYKPYSTQNKRGWKGKGTCTKGRGWPWGNAGWVQM